MKKNIILLLILIIPAFAILLQKGYFSMHDDLQSMRQYQLDKCFSDLQIPCRWVPDMGYGYGYPLFNYYPSLPYLLGQPLRWLGLQYIDVVKIVGILGFIASGLFMYLLAKEFWGKIGGIVSAAFYIYAPYHSVDFYVRGAMNEFWALVFYPAIFWTTYKLIKGNGVGYVPLVAISVAGLMLSHNPMLMIFTPIYLIWIIFWWWRFKSFKSFTSLSLSAIWALGLAAFFTLPVLFETKYVSVWTLTSGYFNYLAHFLDLKQIFFKINWGYGSSILGPDDTMSFALGYLHWIVPGIILICTPFIKKLRDNYQLILISVFYILFSLFMTHSKSTPIWQTIKSLEFLQFPWRFLTLSIFAASFVSGAIALVLPRKFISLLLLVLLILNANYFRPRQWYPEMTDQEKFSGKSWQLLITSGIFDYLPIWAPLPPADPPKGDIFLKNGSYKTLVKKSNLQKYSLDVSTDNTIVELQTYYFPGWKYWLDGVEVKNYKLDPLVGRPQFSVTSGHHELTARFTDTPIRLIGNLMSLISIGALGVYFLTRFKKV